MNKEKMRQRESRQCSTAEAGSAKKGYEKPLLTAFEDLKTVTGSRAS